jgi:hypothetical protein
MSGRAANAAKCFLLLLLVFSPYFALIAWVILTYGGQPPRWFGLVGLVYMIGGIWLCVILTRKMFNKQLTTLAPDVVTRVQETYGRSDFPALTIEMAYISSLDPLKRFQSLPWYTKQLGIMLGDFPTVIAGGRSYPIVYFASGPITLSPKEFKFVARATVGPWKSYSNLNLDLRLDFNPEEVLSMGRFDMYQVTSASVRFPFIRVQTTAAELQDFLVCSGADDLTEAAAETEELLVALESFAENRKGLETLR